MIPSLEQALQDFNPTIDRLLVAFGRAVTEAREYIELKDEPDRSYFSHRVRYVAKTELKRGGVQAEDCELEDTANSGICLVLQNYRARVLKSAEGGEIPDPGGSDRRKRFLNQESEQMSLFPDADVTGEPNSSEREPAHIVFLWEADSKNVFEGLWFICPSGNQEPHFRHWIAAAGLSGSMPVPKTPPPQEDLGFKRKDLPAATGTA
jgi:hypothetical protein